MMSEFEQNEYLWNPKAKADPEMVRLEAALRPLRYPGGTPNRFSAATRAGVTLDPVPAAGSNRTRAWLPGRWPIAAIAAGLLLLAALAGSRRLVRPWAVVTMRDNPGWLATVQTRSPLAAGDWIVTDSTTRARLNVGSLGRTEIGPSSRVRLVRAAMTEHRLALAEGTLRARIWAPPRFFVVETAAAIAVDLGCVYTLKVDRSGAGYLRVESGEVELMGLQLRARVPAGNTVHIYPQTGAGLPFPTQASTAFVAALTAIERHPADTASISQALPVLLGERTPRATITLWHLVPRVNGIRRERVVDRLVEFAPMPAGVERDDIMRLDSTALERWRAGMERQWSNEGTPPWKRWWRAWWNA